MGSVIFCDALKHFGALALQVFQVLLFSSAFAMSPVLLRWRFVKVFSLAMKVLENLGCLCCSHGSLDAALCFSTVVKVSTSGHGFGIQKQRF